MRWNVKSIYLYSHDGRRRDLPLVEGKVNIITGNSHTGKSSIAEVIDYVMGASECHIPGRVRAACAWVGLLWTKENTQCLICRRVPEPTKRAEDDVVLVVGSGIEIPATAADLKANVSRGSSLRKFEQLLGIGDVPTELFGAKTRRPARVSFRSAMPYLLQDDDHIISKGNLLWGTGDERRQSVIDTLPYFLGVVDEDTVARETRLRALKAQLQAEERQAAARDALLRDAGTTARALVSECVQVGLLAATPGDLPPSELHSLLQRIETDEEPPDPFAADDELERLYERQESLLNAGATLRNRLDSARRVLRASEAFVEAGAEQVHRLAVVEVLPNSSETEVCPLCAQSLDAQVDSVSAVRDAVERVRNELRDVERERPQLDGTLRRLEEERSAVSEQLTRVRESISALVRESEQRKRGLELEQRRYRVRGRVSLFLESALPQTPTDAGSLSGIREEAAALESELNIDAKLEGLNGARQRISAAATEIAARLPLDRRYQGSPIDFNPRTLSAGIVTASRREDMRDVGSDENYLTLHVSIMLSLHRLFAERGRPVPGFILFDQLSRPYYPPDPLRELGEEVVSAAQPEVASLKQYFDLLFDEVERGESLQVLILEHAYFSDDDRFVAATRERWIDGNALIPDDWPEWPAREHKGAIPAPPNQS
jgi:hypothetical protein